MAGRLLLDRPRGHVKQASQSGGRILRRLEIIRLASSALHQHRSTFSAGHGLRRHGAREQLENSCHSARKATVGVSEKPLGKSI